MMVQNNLLSIFHATPATSLILMPDAPRFTIAEVNDAYLKASFTTREQLLGRGIFEVFPDNPNEPEADGVANLTASLLQVLAEKKPHKMAVQKYDISLPDGTYTPKYWLPVNIPILGKDGSVAYILHSVEDVTDQFLLKNTLEKNTQAYHSLFEKNPDPVFLMDLDGTFTSANEEFLRMFGYDRVGILTKHFSEICEKDEPERIKESFQACLSGQVVNFQCNTVALSGERISLNITGMPLWLNRSVVGAFAIAKNITQQIRDQKEKDLIATISRIFSTTEDFSGCMRLVLEELRQFTETRLAEVWVSSIDFREMIFIASVGIDDQIFLRSEGSVLRTHEGLIGAAWSSRKEVNWQDLKANPQFWRPELARIYDLDSGIGVPLIYKDQVISVLVFYGPRPGSGQDTFLSANLLDQLASHVHQKRTERELGRYFDMSPDMLCIGGYDGYFKKVSPAATRVLGYSEAELLSRPIASFVHPEGKNVSVDEFIQFTGQSGAAFENCYQTREGKAVWLSWTANRIEDERLVFAVGRDITEKKRLEKIVMNQQQRLKGLISEAPVSMCILKGKDHVFENVNATYCKFTGRTDSVLGKTVREAFPELLDHPIHAWLDGVYKTGETFTAFETPVPLDTEGSGKARTFYLSFMYQAYRNTEGEIEGIYCFGMDVTEQVNARKKIDESEQRYLTLIENLPVAVYVSDMHGMVLLHNKAFVSLFGAEPHPGTNIFNGPWRILGKDGNQLQFDMGRLTRIFKEGVAWTDEIIIERADGSIRYVLPHPSPVVDSDGKQVGYVNVVLDVTESKQADEELRKLSLIAKSTDNAVIITDRHGKIEWVNDAFTKITEYDFQEVIGKTKGELLDGFQSNRGEIDLQVKTSGDKPVQYEILNYTKSGKPFWVEVRHQPMFDAQGNITHYFDLGTDITARKQAYEKLVSSEIEIRSFARQLNSVLEEERARIAREIHDEFGQQLTGLKLSLSSLKIPGIDASAVIDSMLVKMDETIQFLKRFSTELRPAILDTLGLFPAIEWLVDDFEKKTGLRCSLKTDRQDRRSLDKEIAICCFRICQEALTNVVKHAGATTVVVELVQYPHRLLLKISDNGRGIKRGRIRNPFSLGLLGMRERASLVGGRLMIDSTDSGTTVDLVIDLPVISSGRDLKTADA